MALTSHTQEFKPFNLLRMFMQLLTCLLIFGIVVLASYKLGAWGTLFRLPLITGFLLTGILAGPFCLEMVRKESISDLNFINQIALSVIAFFAGNELVLKSYRSRFKSIAWVTSGLVLTTFTVGTITSYYLSQFIPIMQDMQSFERLAVSILLGVILVARSPSSAIAIINELRAKGPFTQTILGVTVIMDVVVIVLFAIGSEFADAVFSKIPFDLSFIGLLVSELLVSLIMGVIVWKSLSFILPLRIHRAGKASLMLLVGYSVFFLSEQLRHYSEANWPFDFFLEPLLICMVGGLLVTNAGPHRVEFSRVLRLVSPPIYVAFFTLTGASIELDVLRETWPIAVAIFSIRMLAIFVGTFFGSTFAGDPPLYRYVSWMGFVTQAGIAIGLSRELASEFSPWGDNLATTIIAVIAINQVLGPPLFKWVLGIVKESRSRAASPAFDGTMDAIIFGKTSGESLMLAHRLHSRGWNVKLAVLGNDDKKGVVPEEIEVVSISDISPESFEKLDIEHADALIGLLSDELNLQICELNYEKVGIEKLVVKLVDSHLKLDSFRELGALVVDSKNSMISLLEHFVSSPMATSILLGLEPDQDVLELEVRDPNLAGVPIRDLCLPTDTLILSLTRNGHALICHGYIQLRLRDRVTIIGPPKSLSETLLYFDE